MIVQSKEFESYPPPSSEMISFSSIASHYDRTNLLLSWGLCRLWVSRFIRQIQKHAQIPIHSCLDLCSGTGDIAFSLVKKVHSLREIYLLDICPEMLQEAKKKNPLPHCALHYLVADAVHPPFAKETFDLISISYGIRNLSSPRNAMRSNFALLRPGGCFAILELTRPHHPLLKRIYSIFLSLFVPAMGKLFTADPKAYSYLASSIRSFISGKELISLAEKEGFVLAQMSSLFWGVASIFIFTKPK